MEVSVFLGITGRYLGSCKKQTVVATSTTEAEYVAAASCCRQQELHTCQMERAATTASSLEAEQDSGSGPRCQDTILGDMNAQTRFEITSIKSINPPISRGYTLGSGEDSMKLIGIDGILVNTVKQKIILPGKSYYCWVAKLQLLSKFLSLEALFKGRPIMSICSQVWMKGYVRSKVANEAVHKGKLGEEWKVACLYTSSLEAEQDSASEEVGEDSGHPTNSTQVPILDKPSTSSKTKKKQSSKKTQRQEAEVSQDETSMRKVYPHFPVLDLEKAKDAQAKKIVALKKRI
ncbi:hypothetical protein Tco_0844424 [Tanacetum coccineum]